MWRDLGPGETHSMSFDEREKAFEEKFKHDQELQFKVTARRNKMLGLWAAAQLGMTGTAADGYAKTIVETEVAKGGGDAAGIAQIQNELAAQGIEASDQWHPRPPERPAPPGQQPGPKG